MEDKIKKEKELYITKFQDLPRPEFMPPPLSKDILIRYEEHLKNHSNPFFDLDITSK